jgi:hypothetical protein
LHFAKFSDFTGAHFYILAGLNHALLHLLSESVIISSSANLSMHLIQLLDLLLDLLHLAFNHLLLSTGVPMD